MSCSFVEVGELTVDGVRATPPSNVGAIVAGVVVPIIILGIVCLIVDIIVFWHLRRKRLQLTKYSDVRIVCHAL